jgi:poly-gamma-glutamate synthesis protein (capsule biosynthesis protein)
MDKTVCFWAKFIISPSKWILTITLVSLILISCVPDQHKEVRIIFTGDILLSRNVRLEIEHRNTSPWLNINSRLKSADLVIGNLEGSVGEIGILKDTSSDKIIFDIPKAYISMLHDAGFSAISIENNHINDLGVNYKDSTIIELLKSGIHPIHINNSPYFFKYDNFVISIIAIDLIPDSENRCQKIPSIEIKQKLRLAKSLSDFVIVTIHWGSELLDWPNQYQRSSAEWLIKNGTDLIIGHHPHVIQSPEIINGKPVFFSIGNHLFDQKYLSTKEGLMVECQIKNGRIKYTGIITHTQKNSYFPEITKEMHYNFPKFETNHPPLYSGIKIVPISIDKNHDSKIILEGFKNDIKIWQTTAMSLVSISSADFDNKFDYLFTLENHYSSIDGEYGLRPYVYSITKTGLVALWRGSALSRPLLDAILTTDRKYMVALHRGDSFINLNSNSKDIKIESYKWNGFGFSGYPDSVTLNFGKQYYETGQ